MSARPKKEAEAAYGILSARVTNPVASPLTIRAHAADDTLMSITLGSEKEHCGTLTIMAGEEIIGAPLPLKEIHALTNPDALLAANAIRNARAEQDGQNIVLRF